MTREELKSISYYSKCVMRLLSDCDDADFVDSICNGIMWNDEQTIDEAVQAYAKYYGGNTNDN